MPEKSVREMSAAEKRRYSLAAKTFRATFMEALVLGLILLFVGQGLFTYYMIRQYISEAFNTSRSVASVLDRMTDIGALSDEVMTTYRALSDEERAEVESDSYRSRFASVLSMEEYETARGILGFFGDSSDMDAIYLAMYDEETSAMVYIVDPEEDPAFAFLPGDWESVNIKGLRKFLNWDGTGRLYDIDRTAKYGWLCTSGVPIRDEAGSIKAFVLTDVSLDNIRQGVLSFIWQYIVIVLLVTGFVGWLMARRMDKTLVQPINAIAVAAQQYALDKKTGVRSSEHFSKLNISTGDEVENLSLIMADMEQDIGLYEEDLTRITAEKERLNTELDLATRIQAAMLPSIFPPFPERAEFDLYAAMRPVREVGGDFYDFFLIDEDHLGLVIADVSGKGVPAALFMMAAKIMIANLAMGGKSPAEILTDCNRAICANNPEGMFISVWIGILDIPTGRLAAANAGHEYPFIRMSGGDYELFKQKHGLVLGAMPDASYREYELTFGPGDKLFVYTDGLPEANDRGGRMFGTEGLLKALNTVRAADVAQTLIGVREALDAFVSGAEQFDDQAMLCLEYKGAVPGKADNEWEGPASVSELETVLAFVSERLRAAGCPEKTVRQVELAVEEIFVNISSYAYAPKEGRACVKVRADRELSQAVITFADTGRPFDPLTAPEPDLTQTADERAIGGLGIFLAKKTADELAYERLDDRNILMMKKAW